LGAIRAAAALSVRLPQFASAAEGLALYGAKADLLALGDFVVAEPDRLQNEEPALARGELRKLFAPSAVAFSLGSALGWVGGVAERLWELDGLVAIIARREEAAGGDLAADRRPPSGGARDLTQP
jgi:hypothetical protein